MAMPFADGTYRIMNLHTSGAEMWIFKELGRSYFILAVILSAMLSLQAPLGAAERKMPDNAMASKFDLLVYRQNAAEIKYRLFRPRQQASAQAAPLVVFMEQAAESEAPDSLGQDSGAFIWASEAFQDHAPCYILAFQSPDAPDEIKAQAEMIQAIVKETASKLPIDPARIYLVGQEIGARTAMSDELQDISAASLYIAAQEEPITSDAMLRRPFVYFYGGETKTNAVEKIEEEARKSGISYTWSSWDSTLPLAQQNEMVQVMLEKDNPINIFGFEDMDMTENAQLLDEAFNQVFVMPALHGWLFDQRLPNTK